MICTCKCGNDQDMMAVDMNQAVCESCGRTGCFCYSTEQPPTEVESVTRPSLEEVQQFVGGTVEIVYTKRDNKPAQMMVNEDGMIYGMPQNYAASAICGYYIAGPAMVLTDKAMWVD